MISFYDSNCGNGKGMATPSLILFLLTILCFSFPAMGIPSRSFKTNNKESLFALKYFLNVDDGSITLIAKNRPLGPVLEEISRRSGIKIQISPALRSKTVSINWKGISVEEGVKMISEESGLLFGRDEEGGLYLSEMDSTHESAEEFIRVHEKGNTPANSHNTDKTIQAGKVSFEAVVSQNKALEDNLVINEMVIRFKQDLSEQDISRFLSDANIKVKKYIATLKYHILSLPDGMSYYDAMLLFKNKKMLYQAEPDFIVPVK